MYYILLLLEELFMWRLSYEKGKKELANRVSGIHADLIQQFIQKY